MQEFDLPMTSARADAAVTAAAAGPFRLRSTLAAIAGALAVALASPAAQAEQPYPARPITMIVPFAAGGPTDVLARIIAQQISQPLDAQIVVENLTGAGGTIGSAHAAKAAPDGYTMVMGNLGTHGASMGLYRNLSYDPRTDFEPVILVATTPMVLLVRKDLPVATLQDFIALAKKRRLSMGSAGIGSISHLALLLFTSLSHTDIQHVPYRGLSQADNDLIGGQIDSLFDQVISATPHIISGAVKPIVVTATARAPSLPNVPSSTEAGLPELQTLAWTALFMPKGTPAPIVVRINAAIDAAMNDPAVVRSFDKLGADVPPPDQRTPQALAGLVRSEVAKWVPLLHAAGVAAE
jgi:tripartite-type tricarboxylate transporter receptor subunit TctC